MRGFLIRDADGKIGTLWQKERTSARVFRVTGRGAGATSPFILEHSRHASFEVIEVVAVEDPRLPCCSCSETMMCRLDTAAGTRSCRPSLRLAGPCVRPGLLATAVAPVRGVRHAPPGGRVAPRVLRRSAAPRHPP